MLSTPTNRIASCVLAALLTVYFVPLAGANSKISIEAVDDYPNCGPLLNNIANVDNFRNRMLAISGYTSGIRYTNAFVLALDFQDPEKIFGGGDMNNFDRSTDAISYFSGHGWCNNSTSSTCTTASGCASMTGFSKKCIRWSENPLVGKCFYNKPRTLTVDSSPNCTDVNYMDGTVALGESSNSGSWAGAGTNGNINFAVIDNSCGVTPGFEGFPNWSMFAGLTTAAFVMPTRRSNDNADVSGRGREWADIYVANTGSAAHAGHRDHSDRLIVITQIDAS